MRTKLLVLVAAGWPRPGATARPVPGPPHHLDGPGGALPTVAVPASWPQHAAQGRRDQRAGHRDRAARAGDPVPARSGGPAEGSRCQDAEATLVTTTLKGPDRWFVLTASLQRAGAPAGAYDRVLASFRLS